ncbi:MAG: hypothetical protein JHC99_02715 [Brevundimonas sp.]|nr:hypothetical protein [Brevundimonas sp.]
MTPPLPDRIDEIRARAIALRVFDEPWYAGRVGLPESQAWDHYLVHGWRELRDPSPLFDVAWYDRGVRHGLSPVARFCDPTTAGIQTPHPMFDPDWYARAYARPGLTNRNAWEDFIATGLTNDPGPLFSGNWYLNEYADIADSGANPWIHFLEHGGIEGRNPGPLFNSAWYLDTYPGVRAAGINPLTDFLSIGAGLGRNPSRYFDCAWYAKTYMTTDQNPLVHFVLTGQAAGFNPRPR